MARGLARLLDFIAPVSQIGSRRRFPLTFGRRGDSPSRTSRRRGGSAMIESLEPRTLMTAVLPTLPVVPHEPSGLDAIVQIIQNDAGLKRRVSAQEIEVAVQAARGMNSLIVKSIRATGLANDGVLNAADVRDLNTYLRINHLETWTQLHGDDEDWGETGFHLVQNDGAVSRLFARNAVNTVADGIYHLAFCIDGNRLVNEDGNANASLENVAFWLTDLLAADLAGGSLANPDVDPVTHGNTGTGLDKLIDLINADQGLQRRIATSEIATGALAANGLNRLIVEAIRETGVANNGDISAADVRDLNAYLRANHLEQWTYLHGDDEDCLETGFHLVQNDGAVTQLYALNAVNTVADGIYHLGFCINGGRLVNEDGNDNASVESVAYWLNDLLAADLAEGSLINPEVEAYVAGNTGTGLDLLVDIITADEGLSRRIATSEIAAGARAANELNAIILRAIDATGVGTDRQITSADIRELSRWIVSNEAGRWIELHGDDEDCLETGFHLVQNDGASTQLFARNAVNTVADGLYHLGFGIQKNRLLNEDGARNASIADAAMWLDGLLYGNATLPAPSSNFQPTTGTGLDRLVSIIVRDQGLNRNLATGEITAGAAAADAMNHLILEAIHETGLANDGTINAADVRDLNAYLRTHHLEAWTLLHGDDEGDQETGFHLVQNDGATSRLFAQNAVNTVADGLYHLGFCIEGNRLVNEDGDANASLASVAHWLSEFLADELASGALANPNVNPYAQGSTATGLDTLIDIITGDLGLNRNIATSEITAGARAADGMNAIIIEAIAATDVSDDGILSAADMIALNSYIRTNHLETWTVLHGDDEDGQETGFHLVQNDGAFAHLFGDTNAVNTVADGIYHLGFETDGKRLLNEDGMPNASLEQVADWLNHLLSAELAGGALA